jgi:hypothetical protein
MIQEIIEQPDNQHGFSALMHDDTTRASRFASHIQDLWHGLRDYFGVLGRGREKPVIDRAGLKYFLETRASFVAQTSLYGYMRTRAGQLYPQLFDEPEFGRLLNIAKWYVWLACLSDLAVYAGGLLAQQSSASPTSVGSLMEELVTSILDDTGIPDEAGDEFATQAQRVLARVAGCDWSGVRDDETPFSESPSTLVHRAPIVDTLKELDEEIVRNSVRFRWQEIRRDLRRNLDAEAVLHANS